MENICNKESKNKDFDTETLNIFNHLFCKTKQT